MLNLEDQRLIHFEFQGQKLMRLYHNTYILLFCIDLSTKPYLVLWKHIGVYDLIEHIPRYFKIWP